MTISPFAVVGSASVTIVKTFFRHYTSYAEQLKQSEARAELSYDEAFWIVKKFLEKATHYTIEEVQSFGNTHVPHPPWVTVVKVVVPAETLVVAARVIVEYLGKEEVTEIAGGETWWQRRARSDGGVEAEWIQMKSLDHDELIEDKGFGSYRKAQVKTAKKVYEGRKHDRDVPPEYTPDMDASPRTMLYIHGGAHYFGSNNTHRYSIWRYARKMGGRAFSVEYRLSPQYPFPCALQDCLAAYLYLIRPPPDARHKPVDPNRIIFAGDSAGGGLVLALLCLVRDMQLPMPACSVLISPWVDLTHSFPSILQNTATDIIMPYGFIHKPSALWPPPDEEHRVMIEEAMRSVKREHSPSDKRHESRSSHPAKNGHANADDSTPLQSGQTTPARKDPKEEVKREKAEKKGKDPNEAEFRPKYAGETKEEINSGDRAEPESTIKIKVDGKPVELSEQIQLYATNEQLWHPLVSPALQPSLGGLTPLLILAGEKEVLRDEIIYVAHRAADPKAYPLRQALIERNGKRAKLAEQYGPTKVHLQVYDGACHVLPLFSFTTPAKYSYRSIASFIRAHTSAEPSPASEDAPLASAVPADMRHDGAATASPTVATPPRQLSNGPSPPNDSHATLEKRRSKSRLSKFFAPGQTTDSPEASANGTPVSGSKPSSRQNSQPSALDPTPRPLKKRDKKRLGETIYTETQPFNRPSYVDNMIRERVGVTGVVRDLEPAKELQALQLKPEDVGLIKEGPVARYLEGRRLWDKKYAKVYERIKKERRKHVEDAKKEEASRIKASLKRMRSRSVSKTNATNAENAGVSLDHLHSEQGVWDLGAEVPPPSSIAARKDTGEALRLAKIVSTQKQSLTHPLALWSEMHDISFLRHERNVRNEDEESSSSPSRSTSTPLPESQELPEPVEQPTSKPSLHVNTEVKR